MRVSRERAAQNRARVLETASRLFREHGLDGVGVADIMGAAGLTHGGFYGQFASKDELATEACARAIDASSDKWDRLCRDNPNAAFSAIVDFYLSTGHREQCGVSCLLSTLPVDVARRDGPVRHVFTEGLKRLGGILARVAPGRSEAARRRKALATLASLVGAVVLARAVDDPALAEDIIAATAKGLRASPQQA